MNMQQRIEALPSNLEAEQCVLGAILVNNMTLDSVSEFLRKGHFFEPLHQHIFEIIIEIIRAGRVATPITVKTYLDKNGNDDFDAPKYLINLSSHAVSLTNIRDYAMTVFELFQKRELMKIADNLKQKAQSSSQEIMPQNIAEETLGKLVNVMNQSQGEAAFFSSAQLAMQTFKIAADALQSGKRSSLSFGYPAIDELLGTVHPGQLIVIPADTKIGKTALALQLSYMLSRQGELVAFRSLEMSPIEINNRLLCSLADVDLSNLVNSKWTPAEGNRLSKVQIDLEKIPLYISGRGRESIDAIRAWAHKSKKYRGAKLLVIDHLRFIDVPGKDKFQKIGEAVLAVKDIATKLEIPIILCAQLGDSCRPDGFYTKRGCIRRPNNSDIYGAVEIEQTADSIIFIHRPDHYLRKMEPADHESRAYKDWSVDLFEWSGQAEFICGASRSGDSCQTRRSPYLGKRFWFGDYASLLSTQQQEFTL